jgi:hypothetical protein
MKQKIYLVLAGLFLLSAQLKAQAPDALNYQGVARDASGSIIPDQSIGLEFTIVQGSSTGTIVYQETQTSTTNEFGLFTVAIGTGTQVGSNTFASIDWGANNEFLEVGMDPAGGTNYTQMGTHQLLSVPYAFYATSSGSGGGGGVTSVSANTPLSVTTPTTTPAISLIGESGTILYGTDGGSAFNAPGGSGQVLQLNGSLVPTWVSANSTLETSSIVVGDGSSVVVTNGNNQVVGESNVTLDVQGNAGGVFYGTGESTSAAFTGAGTTGNILLSDGADAPQWLANGTNGQVLSANGSGIPTWVTPSFGGSVTSVGSGFGLQGGAITTSGTLSIDSSRQASVGIPTIYFVDSTVSAATAQLSQPNQQMVYGTGSGITSSSNLTYDGTNVSLHAGSFALDNTEAIYLNGIADGNWTISRSKGNGEFVTSNSLTLTHATGGGEGMTIQNDGGGVEFEILGSTGAITFNQAYTFPTSDGTIGQALTTDGAGDVSWSTVSGGGTPALTQNQIGYGSASNLLTSDGNFTYNTSQAIFDLVDNWGGLHVEGRSSGEASISLNPDNISNGTAGQWVLATNGSNMNNSADWALYNAGTISQPIYVTQSTNAVTFDRAYTFPTSDGSTGEVLTTDGAGNVSWGTTSGIGTVTSFSSGDLSPLFTTSVTNATSAPALSFTLSNAGAYTILGNNTNAAAAPTYFTPVLASALFANQGTGGYVLQSTGTGAPTWVDPAAAADAWNLTGNTGTTAGTNFLGTTDGNDLVFKTNGAENMRITQGGNVGIGTPTPGVTNQLDVETGRSVAGFFATDSLGDNVIGVEGITNSGDGMGIGGVFSSGNFGSESVAQGATAANEYIGSFNVGTSTAASSTIGSFGLGLATNGAPNGVFGEADDGGSGTAMGVFGEGSSTTGIGYGLYALGSPIGGYGFAAGIGFADENIGLFPTVTWVTGFDGEVTSSEGTNTTDENAGVLGISTNPDGVDMNEGVAGYAQGNTANGNVGVLGVGFSSSVFAYGTEGEAEDTGTGGTAYGAYGAGVSAKSIAYGLYGTGSSIGGGAFGYGNGVTNSNLGKTYGSAVYIAGFDGEVTGIAGANNLPNFNLGVLGVATNPDAGLNAGSFGYGTGAEGNNYGAYDVAQAGSANDFTIGVLGLANPDSGTSLDGDYGGYFSGSSINGSPYGVFGQAQDLANGIATGVSGIGISTNSTEYGTSGIAEDDGDGNAVGAFGVGVSDSGFEAGTEGLAEDLGSGTAYGVFGDGISATGVGYGLYGEGSPIGGYAFASGAGIADTNQPYIGATFVNGLDGEVTGSAGSNVTDINAGVFGAATNPDAAQNLGVFGAASGASTWNYGVYGVAQTNGTDDFTAGVYGDINPNGGESEVEDDAGLFNGNVDVLGTLSKTAGTFKIDDPLDPANKYLYHSFVESPDMMNVYNGNITTDADGNATVALPQYFQAENKDFKYQLTVIGQFAQAIVATEISDNQFTIKTDKPNVKVSWQVTGVRNDPYANEHRVVAEVEKKGSEQGHYIYPQGYGQPQTLSIASLMRAANNKSLSSTARTMHNPVALPKTQLNTLKALPVKPGVSKATPIFSQAKPNANKTARAVHNPVALSKGLSHSASKTANANKVHNPIAPPKTPKIIGNANASQVQTKPANVNTGTQQAVPNVNVNTGTQQAH